MIRSGQFDVRLCQVVKPCHAVSVITYSARVMLFGLFAWHS